MPSRHTHVFACAHLTDERLFAAQVSVLESHYECLVFAFREEDSLGDVAEAFLAGALLRFTLIGLSLGGYVAFEVILRQPHRLERLVLMDTTAVADNPARRAGHVGDIDKVKAGGTKKKSVGGNTARSSSFSFSTALFIAVTPKFHRRRSMHQNTGQPVFADARRMPAVQI